MSSSSGLMDKDRVHIQEVLGSNPCCGIHSYVASTPRGTGGPKNLEKRTQGKNEEGSGGEVKCHVQGDPFVYLSGMRLNYLILSY